jgi:hypothetical protein
MRLKYSHSPDNLLVKQMFPLEFGILFLILCKFVRWM